MLITRTLVYSGDKQDHHRIFWDDFTPYGHDHITFTQFLAKTAHMEYQQTERQKVPRWILRFVNYSLSLDPLPAASIVADCLTIIAIDLGCDISKITISDERCV